MCVDRGKSIINIIVMADIFDYIKWRGDLDFSLVPFNTVDNIILSQLSYLHLDNIVPSLENKGRITIAEAEYLFTQEINKTNSSLKQTLLFREDMEFIKVLGSSKRFGNCELCAYVNNIDEELEKQFSALCIITGDGSSFISFRGTDSTFTGWKESFNMSFSDTVPAQLEAVHYLEKIARNVKGSLRIGGHSKGGNLAIYAAAFCNKKTQHRIKAIYSNDAPGFHSRIIESKGYQEIRGCIQSFIPHSSVIGLLLKHEDDYTVVKSSQIGLMQHSLYSWEITHNDIIHIDHVSKSSRFVDKTIKEWIAELDYEQRQKFIEALFTVLCASQAKSTNELTQDWFKSTTHIIQSLGNIDESTKKIISKTLSSLFRSAKNNFYTLMEVDEGAAE